MYLNTLYKKASAAKKEASTKDVVGKETYRNTVTDAGYKESYSGLSWDNKDVEISYQKPVNSKKHPKLNVEIEYSSKRGNTAPTDMKKGELYAKNADKIADSAIEAILNDKSGYYAPSTLGFSSEQELRKALKPTAILVKDDTVLIDTGWGWFDVMFDPKTYNAKPKSVTYND